MRKKDVKKLAVAYEAYVEAMRTRDRSALQTWGRLLDEAQTATGVELVTKPRTYTVEDYK
jgi:hypothetical protein